MIVVRALIPDSMVIPGSSGSLQMVDHTLIDVRLANVYLNSPYHRGHGKVMRVSSLVYAVIIMGYMRGADPDWKVEGQREARARTSGDNNNENDNQGGDMPSWVFREESNRGKKNENRDSKKKPTQIKKSDNRATEDIKVQQDTTEGKCVAGPVLTRAQVKKSDINPPIKS